MPSLRVLICGGGCAGPSLAFWLSRYGHRVTVVERFPTLRAKGAQIDLRAQGIEVVKRMGLLDAIRRKLVDEDGVTIVDRRGNAKATILANRSGKGAQSLTSEYEIMRGDLVQILYDATKDNVEYVFGKTVDGFEEDASGVHVHFSDGKTDTFDILVGADGQGSRIRKAILTPASPDPIKSLGLFIAYWMVPRDETDSKIRKSCSLPGGRLIMTRNHSPTESQAYFWIRGETEEMKSIPRASIEKQKEFWTRKFQGAGWQTQRFIDGMATTDNFYCQEIVQVRTDTWHEGRVVLMADAAHCASPFSGMGTTGAFVGAYVLAGEIGRNSENLDQAFTSYERIMRPFVDEIQKINPYLIRLAFLETELAIMIFQWIIMLVAFLRIPALIARFSKAEKGGWPLPDYSDLDQKR